MNSYRHFYLYARGFYSEGFEFFEQDIMILHSKWCGLNPKHPKESTQYVAGILSYEVLQHMGMNSYLFDKLISNMNPDMQKDPLLSQMHVFFDDYHSKVCWEFISILRFVRADSIGGGLGNIKYIDRNYLTDTTEEVLERMCKERADGYAWNPQPIHVHFGFESYEDLLYYMAMKHLDIEVIKKVKETYKTT